MKTALWIVTDAQGRKRREQTGLDTLVVYAVNDGHWLSESSDLGGEANALSDSPGDYGRKAKTQRN